MWRTSVVAVMVSGCGAHAHVRLAAPPADAPAAVMLATYDRLHAVEIVAKHQRNGTVSDYALDLADGTRVDHAEDLLPVVDADSTTARAAEHRRESAAHL